MNAVRLFAFVAAVLLTAILLRVVADGFFVTHGWYGAASAERAE